MAATTRKYTDVYATWIRSMHKYSPPSQRNFYESFLHPHQQCTISRILPN